MNIDRSGIILYVEHYEQCVSFYANILEFAIEFQKSGLTAFSFGNSYLLIEEGGVASNKVKTKAQNPCILRINVENIKEATKDLAEKGVEAEYTEYEWGTVALFTDPDGNYCELKDAETFNKQVKGD